MEGSKRKAPVLNLSSIAIHIAVRIDIHLNNNQYTTTTTTHVCVL
jgi:hypothetical protein